MGLANFGKGMLFSVAQVFVGRDEIQAPLKMPAWEAREYECKSPHIWIKIFIGYWTLAFCIVNRELSTPIPNEHPENNIIQKMSFKTCTIKSDTSKFNLIYNESLFKTLISYYLPYNEETKFNTLKLLIIKIEVHSSLKLTGDAN